MAERLQESVEIIRRDRDRSREFLADVSHELRTPIAALRTFNELLTEGAADDPSARAEFLETSRAQLERLDWLAQNLLELSKLDSGLVLLDLRREDLRSSVEQAVEQAAATARRRGVELTMDRPEQADPDPPRPGPDRPGRREPRRQRDQVHAARRVRARRGHVGRRPRAAPRSRSRTPGSGSTPPSCRGSSTGSSAARGPPRRAGAGAASAWRSSGASWRCTAGPSRSRAGPVPAPRSGSCSRPTPGRLPARRAARGGNFTVTRAEPESGTGTLDADDRQPPRGPETEPDRPPRRRHRRPSPTRPPRSRRPTGLVRPGSIPRNPPRDGHGADRHRSR